MPKSTGPAAPPAKAPAWTTPDAVAGASRPIRTTAYNNRPGHDHPRANATSAAGTTATGEGSDNTTNATAPTSICAATTGRLRPWRRSARCPPTTRTTMFIALPAAIRMPACPGVSPTWNPHEATNEPSELAAALASEIASIVVTSAAIGGGSSSTERSTRFAPPRDRHSPATAIPRPAKPVNANVHRQPITTPTVGTASPAIMIDRGMADCFTPKPSPRRWGGTTRAMVRLDVTWHAAFATPRTTIKITSTGHEYADQASPKPPAAASSPAATVLVRRPSRSASPPPSSAETAAAAKNAPTAIPNFRSPNPRSARMKTDWEPRRKTGSVPKVVIRLAPSTVHVIGGTRRSLITRLRAIHLSRLRFVRAY